MDIGIIRYSRRQQAWQIVSARATYNNIQNHDNPTHRSRIVLYDPAKESMRPFESSIEDWELLFKDYLYQKQKDNTLSTTFVQVIVVKTYGDFNHVAFEENIARLPQATLDDIWMVARFAGSEAQKNLSEILNRHSSTKYTVKKNPVIDDLVAYCHRLEKFCDSRITPAHIRNLEKVNIFIKLKRAFTLIRNGVEQKCETFPLSDNPIIKIALWLNNQIADESISLDVIRTYYHCFSTSVRRCVIKKLFYLHSRGLFEVKIPELIALLESSPLIQDIRFKLFESNTQDISAELLVHSVDSYIRTGEFLTSKAIINLLCRLNVATYDVRLTAEMVVDYCDGGIICNARFNGFLNIERNDFGYKVSVNNTTAFKNNVDPARIAVEVNTLYAEHRCGTEWLFDLSEERKITNLRSKLHSYEPSTQYRHTNTELQFLFNFRDFIRTKNVTIDRPKMVCNGRQAKQKHALLDKEYLWCNRKYCFSNAIRLADNRWEQYNILNCLHACGYDVYIVSECGLIPNEQYARFLDTLQKIELMKDSLFCNQCDNLLHPHSRSTNERVSSYNTYVCVNKECSAHNQPLYVNHCFNLNCKGIVDSRKHKQCPNKMYICPECFGCCTDDFFTYMSRGYPQAQEKKGHNNTDVYFCYQCGNQLVGDNCPQCGIARLPSISRKRNIIK